MKLILFQIFFILLDSIYFIKLQAKTNLKILNNNILNRNNTNLINYNNSTNVINKIVTTTNRTMNYSEQKKLEKKVINKFISFNNNEYSPWSELQNLAQKNLEIEEVKMKHFEEEKNEMAASLFEGQILNKELSSVNKRFKAKMDEDGLRIYDHGFPIKYFGPKFKKLEEFPVESADIHNDKYKSINNTKKLIALLEPNGNLVIKEVNKNNYNTTNNTDTSTIIWQSNSSNIGKGPYKLYMNNNRNLEIREANNKPIWTSDTESVYNEAEIQTAVSTYNSLNEVTIAGPISLFSLNGKYRLFFRQNGLLTLYKGNTKIWDATTTESNDAFLVLTNEGSLSIEGRDKNDEFVLQFTVGTLDMENGPFTLYLTNDGNLEMYSDINHIKHWSLK